MEFTMKKLTTIASVLLLASTTFVYAGNDHNHSAMEKGGMAMSGMSTDMQSSMQAMKADMNKIMQEKDPAKRKAMMAAHMKSMHAMMNSMKGDKKSMMSNDHMDQMAKFDKRLSMMEAMMEQVVVNQAILAKPDSVFKWDENADEYQLQ